MKQFLPTPSALSRRQFLQSLAASALASNTAWPLIAGATAVLDPSTASDAQLLGDLKARTFAYFWETANPSNGLVPDRWPGNPRLCSVAAVGFALTAYIIGVETGQVSREAARDRALVTARFFANATQGPQASGTSGHQGFFYHFLDMQTGVRFDAGVELSSIDTGLLLMGLLAVQSYFDRNDEGPELELRSLVERIYSRVNWPWMQQRVGMMCMGWNPESGFQNFIDYKGYDEASFLYLLALASPTYPVAQGAWQAFCSSYDSHWGTYMGYEHLNGSPLFFHQYTQVWLDMRGLQDDYMRKRGMDYFENSRRATLAQQAYAIQNQQRFNDYGAQVWGLTACDGPGMIKGPDYLGRQQQFFDYRARGASRSGVQDDGTIAPTAALSSLPFAPEIVLPTLRAFHRRFGQQIYGRFGFVDSFNTSFRVAGAKLSDGRAVEGFGWVATDYIGIDQGAILGMAANYQNALVWRIMQRSAHLRRGLQRAGFQGGWLA